MPYGGVKDSGNTREGPRYAVEHMTERKLIVLTCPRTEGGAELGRRGGVPPVRSGDPATGCPPDGRRGGSSIRGMN